LPPCQLVRAGDLRPVRRDLRGAPRADPHHDARRLAGPPVAARLSGWRRASALHGHAPYSRHRRPARLTMAIETKRVKNTLRINMGPQHPSTHGVLRLELELDGEVVVSCKPIIGYLHTGIEKSFESMGYLQGLTLTDRMDY